MEVLLPNGFASQYLITDAKRYLSVIKPEKGLGVRFIFFDGNYTIEDFAQYLTRERPKKTGFWSKFFGNYQRASFSQTSQSLNEILNDKRPTFLLDFYTPIVFLCSSFDPAVLRIIKIVSLRGFCKIGAVQLGSSYSLTVKEFEAIASTEPDYIREQPSCKAYTNCKSAMLISGLESTVISSIRSIGSVLKDHPELSQKMDLANPTELI